MVATRRGVRVSSPGQTPSTQAPRTPAGRQNDTATPSSTVRTRTRAAAAVVQSEETSEQPDQSHDDETGPLSPARSLSPTMTRRNSCAKLHHTPGSSPQPRPSSSPHEADVSESESCCSVVSEAASTDQPITRRQSRRRSRAPPTIGQGEKEDEGAEPGALSDDSSYSASTGPITRRGAPRRSQRKKPLPRSSDDSAPNQTPSRQPASGAESGSSAVSCDSSSHRMTRSQRRTASVTVAPTPTSKSTNEDTNEELSEAESHTSTGCPSTVRRTTRGRGRGGATQPIPIDLPTEETTATGEAQRPPLPPRRSTRTPRRSVKPKEAEGDSEGLESGPSSPRRSLRKRAAPLPSSHRTTDSDSESESVVDAVGRGERLEEEEKEEALSSRTPRLPIKALGVLLEKLAWSEEETRSPKPKEAEEEPMLLAAADPEVVDDITLTLEEEEEEEEKEEKKEKKEENEKEENEKEEEEEEEKMEEKEKEEEGVSVVAEAAEAGEGEGGEERGDGSPEDDVVPAQETPCSPLTTITTSDTSSATITTSDTPPATVTTSDTPPATITTSDTPPATVTTSDTPPATITTSDTPPATVSDLPAVAEMAEDAVAEGSHQRELQSPQDVEVAAEAAVTTSSFQRDDSPEDVAENEAAVTASDLQGAAEEEADDDPEGSTGHTVTVKGTAAAPTVVAIEGDEDDAEEEEEVEAMEVEEEKEEKEKEKEAQPTPTSKSTNEDTNEELSEAESHTSTGRPSTVRRTTRGRGRGGATQPIPIDLPTEETTATGEAQRPPLPPRRSTRTPRRSVKPKEAEGDSEGFESGPSSPRRSLRKRAAPLPSSHRTTDSESESVVDAVVAEAAEAGEGGEERGDGSPEDDVVPAQETPCSPPTTITTSDTSPATITTSDTPPATVTTSDTPPATITTSDTPPATVTTSDTPPATITTSDTPPATVSDLPAVAEMAEDTVAEGSHQRELQSPQDVEVAAEAAVTTSSFQRDDSPEDVAENEAAVTASDLQGAAEEEVDDDPEGFTGHTVTVKGTAAAPTVVAIEGDEDDAEEEEEVEAMEVEEEKEKEEKEKEAQSSVRTPQQAESRKEEPGTPPPSLLPEQAASPPAPADLIVITGGEEERDSVVVAKSAVFSLLDSSDEEEEEEEERGGGEEEEDEDVLCVEGKEPASPSSPRPSSSSAAAAVDGLFVIDKRPGLETGDMHLPEREEEEEEEEFVDEEGGDDDDDEDDDEDHRALFGIKEIAKATRQELSSSIDPGLRVKHLGGLYVNFTGSQSKAAPSSLKQLKEKKIQDEVMKKSVIGPEFEKQDSVPPYKESKEALKKKRRLERGKTAGDGWFNMAAPEMTSDLRKDLTTLKMRAALDPKRFYKKNDREGFPKHFQVATMVDSPVDFYHSRVPKKLRKRTMVEELMADAEFRQTNKRKYQQIMTEKAAAGAGRKNRKKSKFQK